MRFLDGNPHTPIPSPLLSIASRLYCVIHVTGGKVGASNHWRKALDETLKFGTNAVWCLRTTFTGGISHLSKYLRRIKLSSLVPPNVPVSSNGDPTTPVPLHLERLKCSVTILIDLLRLVLHAIGSHRLLTSRLVLLFTGLSRYLLVK